MRFVRPYACVAFMLAGCAHSVAADPKDVLRSYAEAARRGDARALYGLLSDASKRDVDPRQFEEKVAEERVELARQAEALVSPRAAVRTSAQVRLEGGGEVTLDLEGGQFLVRAGDALPVGATTPEQALGQLGRALARQSYAALLRILSPRVRSAVEADVRALTEGLANPDALDVRISGDGAEVKLEGGHSVHLRRDRGVWKVEDFD